MSQPAELMLKPEQVLPAGYQERMVPQELLKDVTPYTMPTRFWMRGVVWRGDWRASAARLAEVAAEHGYRKVNHAIIPNLDQLGVTQDDVYLVYESEYGTVKLGLINIKLLRDRGADMGTTADFIFLACEDSADYEAAAVPGQS